MLSVQMIFKLFFQVKSEQVQWASFPPICYYYTLNFEMTVVNGDRASLSNRNIAPTTTKDPVSLAQSGNYIRANYVLPRAIAIAI